jgi:hypothetical protein
MTMPNWLLPLLALIALVGFIGFAFRQGTKVKPSGNAHEVWTGDDGMRHGSGGDGNY